MNLVHMGEAERRMIKGDTERTEQKRHKSVLGCLVEHPVTRQLMSELIYIKIYQWK